MRTRPRGRKANQELDSKVDAEAQANSDLHFDVVSLKLSKEQELSALRSEVETYHAEMASIEMGQRDCGDEAQRLSAEGFKLKSVAEAESQSRT